MWTSCLASLQRPCSSPVFIIPGEVANEFWHVRTRRSRQAEEKGGKKNKKRPTIKAQVKQCGRMSHYQSLDVPVAPKASNEASTGSLSLFLVRATLCCLVNKLRIVFPFKTWTHSPHPTPVEQSCKQFYIWQIIIGKSHSTAQSFSPQFSFEWMWKNKCINAFLAEGMNKVLTQNRWNFDWLNELIHELEFALMTDWQTPRQCLGFLWRAASPSWILLMRHIAPDSGWSQPNFATPCCDSRYSPSSTAPGGMTNSKNKWVYCWIHTDHSWQMGAIGTSYEVCRFSQYQL